jgi:hypothetical protein
VTARPYKRGAHQRTLQEGGVRRTVGSR